MSNSTCCCLDNQLPTRLHSGMRALLSVIPLLLGFAIGCGSSAAPAVRAHPTESAATPETHKAAAPREPTMSTPKVAAANSGAQLPVGCAGTGKGCYPPLDFVRTLCKKRYPGVAVVMFNKSAPWQHAYVKVKDVAPFNSLGGPSAPWRLEFLEEVLLLRERQPKPQQNMMVMDLPVTYDVLRFDGTCATLANDEFMTKKPVVRPHYAPVIWQQIDTRVRLALAQNPKIAEAAEVQNTVCQGTFLAGGGEACRDATQKLTRAIMAVLSEGVELPSPSKIPDWPSATSAEHAASLALRTAEQTHGGLRQPLSLDALTHTQCIHCGCKVRPPLVTQ